MDALYADMIKRLKRIMVLQNRAGVVHTLTTIILIYLLLN